MYRALFSFLIAVIAVDLFYLKSLTRCPIDGHYFARYPHNESLLDRSSERTIHIEDELVVITERRWQESMEQATSRSLLLHGANGSMLFEWETMGKIKLLEGHFTNDCNGIIVDTEGEQGWQIKRINEEEANVYNQKDSVSEMPSPYKIRSQGKLVILAGPPGSGKSSIAMWLRDNAGFVYYEVDAFYRGLNPYVTSMDVRDLDKQPALVGKGMQRRKDFLFNHIFNFNKGTGTAFVLKLITEVKNERKRLGGDWVIPLVMHPMNQPVLYSLITSDTITVVLDLDSEIQEERLKVLHRERPDYASYLMKIFSAKNYRKMPIKWNPNRTVVLYQKKVTSVAENSQEVLRMIKILSTDYLSLQKGKNKSAQM